MVSILPSVPAGRRDVVSVFMSLIAVTIRQAERRRNAAEAIKKAGSITRSMPGDGYFDAVVEVWERMSPNPTMNGQQLQQLEIRGC